MSQVDPEAIRWAYRLFLDREPETDAITKRPFPSRPALREALLGSEEYRMKNPGAWLQPETWVIKESVHGFRIWLSVGELGVSRPILNDVYEAREVEVIKRLVKTGDTVLDIGTNIGFYSLLLSRLVGPTGSVTGFEPLRKLFDKASLSVAENGFSAFCKIHNAALSNRAGKLKLRHAPLTTNFGGGHLAPAGDVPPDHLDVQVDVLRLDDNLPTRRVSFIKIDIEGAEPLALAGAKALLQRDRPTILAELHNQQLKIVAGSSADELIQWMATLGYRCHSIDDDALASPLQHYRESAPINVLFVPRA